MSQPSEEAFTEWLDHPVTEWILAQLRKRAAAQQKEWSELAWNGDLSPILLNEAKVRADCYLAIPECSYEDWIANDSED